jgi:UDP-N-acetylglucosamine 2-epimerase (non-hydrolysing)
MKMKLMTVLGTRPEIIRLSLIIKKLDQYCEHILVHTGQNFDDNLSSVFFKELDLREPDHYLGIKADTFGKQIGQIMIEAEKVIIKEKPDRILILGDTNSGLVSIIARRMGIPVFHMEAGNRCFDYRVPEEANRVIIDHCSTILLPYTYRSKENLRREGFSNEAIYVIGNPIHEVISHFSKEIEKSKILDTLSIKPKNYFLVTMHRAENVDDEYRMKSIFTGLDRISCEYNFPVICSTHPRTRNKIEQFGIKITNNDIRLSDPFGFFDFIHLEKNSACVITDSGTVQEECCIMGIPNITIRDVTERPETIECGSNMLTSISPKIMMKAVDIALHENHEWQPPPEYLDNSVSSKVIKVILGYLSEQQNTPATNS